ncbi:MAG: MoxR family ATPase [bacterium]
MSNNQYSIRVADMVPTLDHLYAHARRHAVMFVGPTGVGKTDVVRAWAAAHGFTEANGKLCVVHAAHIEPTDVYGIPIPDRRSGTTDFYPNAFWPWGGGILFLDELNRAAIATLNALLQVVLDKRVGAKRLPDDLFIVAAANPPGGSYHVTPLSSPMVGRFAIYHVDADPDGWLAWAARRGIHPVVQTFISRNRDALNTEDDGAAQQLLPVPNPRNWERLHDALNGARYPKDLGVADRILHGIIGACVGQAMGYNFLTFWRSIDAIPEPEDLFSGKAKLPKKLDHALVAGFSLVSWLQSKVVSGADAETMVTTLLQRQLDDGWDGEVVTAMTMRLASAQPGATLTALTRAQSKDGKTFDDQYGDAAIQVSKELEAAGLTNVS